MFPLEWYIMVYHVPLDKKLGTEVFLTWAMLQVGYMIRSFLQWWIPQDSWRKSMVKIPWAIGCLGQSGLHLLPGIPPFHRGGLEGFFWIPSGERLHSNGKSPFFMGKSTISTGPFSIAFCMFTRGYVKTSATQKITRSMANLPRPSVHRLPQLSISSFHHEPGVKAWNYERILGGSSHLVSGL